MKLSTEIVDGEAVLTLSEVYSGIGIKTNMGLFGIAQRDGGIEVLFKGKTVWTSHELPSAPKTLDEVAARIEERADAAKLIGLLRQTRVWVRKGVEYASPTPQLLLRAIDAAIVEHEATR